MAGRGAGPDRGPGGHRIVLTRSPCCPVPDSGSVCARLPPLPPIPRGSRSGSCIFPVTHKNQLRDARLVLGSYVASNERKATGPRLTPLQGPHREEGLPAQPAWPWGWEQPGSKVTASVTGGLHCRAMFCDGGREEPQRSGHCRAGAGVTPWGQQPRPGGQQGEDRAEGARGWEPSVLMLPALRSPLGPSWRTEGSVLRAGGEAGGGSVHVQVSTRRGAGPPPGPGATGTDRCCLTPPRFRSRRRMTPSGCLTPSATSLSGVGRSQTSPWAACPCGPCLCRGR